MEGPTSVKKAVVAGGSGFIGRALIRELAAREFEVVSLSRGHEETKGARTVPWDGRTVAEWNVELENADLVVNFAGSSIATRWTPANRQKIRDSRIWSTEALGNAIQACEHPPKHWINASAVGFYGDRGTREISEAAIPGTGFLAEVSLEWEKACLGALTPLTKKSVVRIGSVLGRDSGLLPQLLSLVRKFLGGAAGSGDQYVSWIHLADLVSMIVWLAEGGHEGIFNGTAPNPVPNRVLMAELRRAAGRPWSPPVPSFAIKLGSMLKGVDPSLILCGARVVPQQALARDFEFRYPTLSLALKDLV